MTDFIITTTPNVEGYIIEKYCGIVGGNSVLPWDFYKDHNVQESLSDIIDKAKQLGANAIVGLNIIVWADEGNESYQSYGTAVRIREANKQPE